MSGVYIHDGRRSGHHSWAVNAVNAGAAAGVVISPFSSPRFTIPRYASGSDFAAMIRGASGDVVFDAMTHARLLPGSNRTDLYDSWELWGTAGIGLDTAIRRQQHIERVFAMQSLLSAPHLAPTVSITVPSATLAHEALEVGWLARGIDESCWQSLAATKAFWKSGPLLDAHIGSLVELRSPVWVVTVTNEMVLDQAPDLSDHDAFEGLLRTIHSLSQRSRVILSYSDFSGLLGIAAGADTVGAGWDRAMRTFDPASFHVDSDAGIRIPASYVTQQGLLAVLRRDAAEAIERWNPAEALGLRGGPIPPSDQAERMHHLARLSGLVDRLNSFADKRSRIADARLMYETAMSDFDAVIGAVGPAVKTADKNGWTVNHHAILRGYATAEGLW